MRKKYHNIIISVLLLLLGTASLHAQPWRQGLPDTVANFYTIQKQFNKYFAEHGPIENQPVSESEEGNGWMLFKRWEWFMEPRVYPSGQLFEPGILQSRIESHSKLSPRRLSSGANWSLMGPSVIPTDGGVGRMNCIAVHPSDTNIIWTGAASGGLWKSTNGGATWSTNTDQFATLGVSSVVFNPLNPNTMYIATGDGDAYDTYSVGILKSTDGGTNWNTTGLSWNTNQTYTISTIVPHPTDSLILLASGAAGIWRTDNGGTSWWRSKAGDFKDLTVDPSDPNVWYAAWNGVGVYKSTNKGINFIIDTVGLPSIDVARIAIAVAPSLPTTLYALYVNGAGGLLGFYISTNSGGTWTLQSSTPNILSWDGTGSDGQGWYDLVLDVDPNMPSTVYVGGINMYRSTNSGKNWTKLTHWYEGTSRPYIHADQHGFAFSPGSNTKYFVANDGGLFKTTNSGATWTDLSAGFSTSQFYRLGCSATNSERIFLGSQDNGSSRYLSGAWAQVLGGDGMEALIDYTDENIGYGSLYYGSIYRTTDGGATFTPISGSFDGSGAWVTPYVINPVNPRSLYVLANVLYKSTNRGDSWTTLSSNVGYNILAIAPSDTNVIYAGSYSYLRVSTNGGTSWATISGSFPAAAVTSVAIDPLNPSAAYVTFSGFGSQKVYKTTNRGTNWTNISTGLPAIPTNSIVINGANNDLYVGTDVGVYRSTDDGASWVSFSDGIPNVVIDELEIHVGSQKLRAATYGRGLWETLISNQHGSIAGTLFEDVDGDGVKDAGEPALQNWKVRISGLRVDSVLTDVNGNYAFSDLPRGAYSLTEDPQVDWHLSSPVSNNRSVTLPGSGTIADQNFGNCRLGSFGGIVFHDLNYNGVQDVGDSGVAGWTIRVLEVPTASAVTDSTGHYEFQDLMPGAYTVSESTMVGWFQTNPWEQAPRTASILSGSNTADINFGNYYSPLYNSSIASGWNMISFPFNVWDYRTAILLPTAISFAFAYEGMYVEKDTLANGAGYWIKFSEGQLIGYRGFPRSTDSIEVTEGWNLIGSISEPVAVADISSTPPGIITSQFFGYNQNYTITDSIYCGKGYWAKVNAPGKLILSHSGGSSHPAGLIKIIPINELPPAPPGEDAAGILILSTYKLEQAYPNPFNPSTVINYQIPFDGWATLKIFDVLGKEVTTLVNGEEAAGYKSVSFNATGLPSGVYYYRLQTENYTETKKLLLIR